MQTTSQKTAYMYSVTFVCSPLMLETCDSTIASRRSDSKHQPCEQRYKANKQQQQPSGARNTLKHTQNRAATLALKQWSVYWQKHTQACCDLSCNTSSQAAPRRLAEADLMLQAVPFSTHSFQHDAGMMLLTVKMSNGGLPGLHHLPQLTHQLTLHKRTHRLKD